MIINVPDIYTKYSTLYNKDRGMAIIIRHSEKYENFPDGDTGLDIDLTPKGVDLARVIGSTFFKDRDFTVFSSPVKRCVDTAKYIFEGANQNPSIIRTSMLGEPGPYVVHPEKCQKLFMELGTRRLVRQFISGQKFECMRTLEEGSLLLLKYIMKMIVPGKTVIFISHDAILMPFFAYLTNSSLEGEWIEYMDGGIIYGNMNSYFVYFKGREMEVKV